MSLRHFVIPYDQYEYPFSNAVYNILGTELDLLHQQKDYKVLSRKLDQSTIWHEKFYTNPESFKTLYYNFIENWVSKVIREDFVYQELPTLRVQLPNNVAVGEP